MLQNARVTTFTVSEILRGKATGKGVKLSHTQIPVWLALIISANR